MEVRLPRELNAKLSRMATQRGRAPASLVQEAVARLVDYDAWFLREVDKGLAQIEGGALLEHEEVGRRIEKLLSRRQSLR
jgi:predicted transcriptional regulator